MDKLLTVENLFLFTLLVALLCNLVLLLINFRNINKLKQKNNSYFNLGSKWLTSITRIMSAYRNNKDNFENILNEEYLIAEDYAKAEEKE